VALKFADLKVLTPSECRQFIAITEQMGYSQALVTLNGGMQARPDVRDNQRVMWHLENESLEIARILWRRIQAHVPPTCIVGNRVWTSTELNPRLRFYKYEGEQEFKPHYVT
jgi:hypothetical protein